MLILNHFRGAQGWIWAERLLQPLASTVGFRSGLGIEVIGAVPQWRINSIQRLNLFGLSTLIDVSNGG